MTDIGNNKEGIIIENQNQGQSDMSFDKVDYSFSDKLLQTIADGYAKILGKKKFKQKSEQISDDQIVSVVQEVYLKVEDRKQQVGDWILDDKTSNLVHAAYKHKTENRVLICYRGTDFKNMRDLLSDVQIVLGVNSIDGRIKQSLEFYDYVQMRYPQAKKWVCGHSLGGTISYIVTQHRNPERCIVFNPGSAPTKSFLGMLQDSLVNKLWTKKVTTYKIWGDVVSFISFVGNVKNFILKDVNPLKLHSIDSFVDLFQEEKKQI